MSNRIYSGTDTGCVGATDQCFQQTAGLSGGGKKKKYKKRRTQRKREAKVSGHVIVNVKYVSVIRNIINDALNVIRKQGKIVN